jgi:hypothetical protein
MMPSVELTLAMLVVVKLGVTRVTLISAMSAIKHSFALIVFTMLSVSFFRAYCATIPGDWRATAKAFRPAASCVLSRIGE